LEFYEISFLGIVQSRQTYLVEKIGTPTLGYPGCACPEIQGNAESYYLIEQIYLLGNMYDDV
jgi:hypothetical protein